LKTLDTWRKASIYVVIPCILIAGVNAYRLWTEHWEHKAHEPPLEERVEMPFMNIRTKNYFWGDGDKVCSNSSAQTKEQDIAAPVLRRMQSRLLGIHW